jgi:hypothetical protein
MKISITTPTVRPSGLLMVAKCLKRQDFKDFEWIIICPERMFEAIDEVLEGNDYKLVAEPKKRPDDYYRLSGAFNKGFQEAKGELIVSITDLIWFSPDTLTRFWSQYQHNPKACITTIGHQYEREESNKPEGLFWMDPRARNDHGTFYQVSPADMELCLASLPKQAVFDSGGIDEEYDRGAAVGEKEMFWRLDQLGYKFYIDQSIEYRALKHPRLTTEWDEKYKIASSLFIKHMQQMQVGERQLNVGYVENA